MLAALLRALFFTFQRLQRYCEHCFLRFIVCSVTASVVFYVSALAALLRALFFAFYRLQRYCEHCFLHFIACSVTASIKIFIFTFAEWRYVLENGRGGAYVPARTSAQRRFHTKIYLRITYHARGFNDGCALGRATRAGTQAPPLPNSIIPCNPPITNGPFGHVPTILFII